MREWIRRFAGVLVSIIASVRVCWHCSCFFTWTLTAKIIRFWKLLFQQFCGGNLHSHLCYHSVCVYSNAPHMDAEAESEADITNPVMLKLHRSLSPSSSFLLLMFFMSNALNLSTQQNKLFLPSACVKHVARCWIKLTIATAAVMARESEKKTHKTPRHYVREEWRLNEAKVINGILNEPRHIFSFD